MPAAKRSRPEQSLAGRVVADSHAQCVLVGALAFLLYANTLSHGYVLDDAGVIVKNRLTQQGMRAIPQILAHSYYSGYNLPSRAYRPLSVATFALEVQFFGNSAAVSHAVNVLLFAAAGIAVLLLLRRLWRISGAPQGPGACFAPLAGALLFVAHPIHTEAVANIKGRDELIAFLGISGALSLILRFESERRLRDLLLAALCYGAALLGKESAITLLPLVPITCAVLARTPLRKAALATLVFAAVSGAYLVVRSALLNDPPRPAECPTNSLALAADLPARWTTAVYVLGQYLKLLLVPHPLVYDYSYNQIPLLTRYDLKALAPLAVHLGLGAYAASRIRARDLVAYGVLFYLVTMSVASNLLVLTGVTMAERLLFTPSLGFCLAAAALLAKLAGGAKPKLALAVLVAALAAYSLLTIDRNRAWSDNYTLTSRDAPHTRASAKARLNLGAAQLGRSQRPMGARERESLLRDGIENCSAVLAICPSVIEARASLGWAHERLGETEGALRHYELVIGSVPALAEHVAALYLEVGSAARGKGDYARARAALERAAALHPSRAAFVELAATLRDLREPALAEVWADRAARLPAR
ncbi:MAG: hypothetical protein DMG07_12850 [Acidobacteria bacterium]|nr:MAG: hypothetical protein DMG07_12850 [Acidobacteriota bacterium]